MRTARLAIAVTIAACSGDSDDKPATPPPPPPADAAVIDGITQLGTPDPNAHVDEDPARTTTPARPKDKRPGRPIEIVLRSSPPNATVYVDGLEVGRTPTYWVGETGAEHEFTFSLPKHALARYKFFPIATGTLHARLDPVAVYVDAGVPPPHLVQPPPIPPPETLAAPAPIAPDAPLAPTTTDAPLAPALDATTGPGIGPTP
ncbi:MAG: PEGA domain-containing protein [Kofleriaceae bacterium]